MKPISTSNRYARLLSLFTLIVCTVLYSPVIEAQQKMYWTDFITNKIQRADLTGSNVEDLVTTGLIVPQGIALDLSNSKMYWIDAGTRKIQRADLTGSNVEDLVTTGLSGPLGIALDLINSKMYWTDFGTDKIQRANFDVSNVEDLVTGLSNPFGIALDLANSKMYWTDLGTDKIQRANLDGSNVEDLVTNADGLSSPQGIALDLTNSKMYWADFGTNKIQRADLTGSNVEDLVTGLSSPVFIALEVSDITLPVELSIFTAESHIDGVLLRWRTESETNNLGFHIYRSQQKAGEYVRITLALIGGQGNTNTARDYSFVDETAQQGATYWYLIEDVDLSGIRERSDPIELVSGRYGVPLSVIPTQFRLWQNYPNPFNPETWIPYQLATPATLVIKIYDAQGNLVRILDLGQQESGFYHSRERAAYWNGRNDAGEQGSSGIYYYHFQAGDYSATRKMLILK